MREILFRGKAAENYGKYKIGNWVYGNFMEGMNENDCYINPKGTCSHIKVNPETVGQYTEQKDLNGNKIFEGDILMRGNNREDLLCIWWNDETSSFCAVDDDCMYEADVINSLELFDNRYDSPELLDVINPKDDEEE